MERFDIKEYISATGSVCREERQFALYLHNVLLCIGAGKFKDKKKEILEACGLPPEAHIKYVFYEATFMRDIFKPVRNVRPLNEALMNYIREKHPFEMDTAKILELKVVFKRKERKDKKPQDEESLSGIRMSRVTNDQINGLKVGDIVKNALFTARAMMNSKPDLAVIYENDSSEKGNSGAFLKFIECKYTSGESRSKGKMKQTETQELIAGFLCKYVFKDVSIKQNSSVVELVRFMKEKNGKGGIKISDLIDLNSRLFQ